MVVHSAKKGERSEGIVLSAIIKAGLPVLMPFGYAHRYDLVIDTGTSFIRVQVKTGRSRNGAVVFNSCSSDNISHKRKDYRGEVDVFVVFCPDNDGLYMVPVDAVGRAEGYLRLLPSKSGQKKGILMAKDYLFERRINLF